MTIEIAHEASSRRRPTSLTVRADLLRDAKALRVNTSRAAEAGIEAAVKKAKGEAWLRENKAAIDAYNERIKKDGMLITPIWLKR